jgi:GNAT superfamily N-acetyltransferase
VEVSYEPVADGDVVAVVTFLDMREPPPAPVPRSTLALQRIEGPDVERYRALFRLVGARWLWFSRLVMDDDKLAGILGDPGIELFTVVDQSGSDVGMVELDFRQPGECELAFLGLVPELSGKGHGTWLLGETLVRAWREGVSRVHVHTCSLDHPAALTAYVRSGFRPYKRAIERFHDPRALGILPADCAPQVPLLGTDAAPRPDSWA